MILSGEYIRERLGKDIFIDPFHEDQLNPNSYNLTLHNELLVYDNRELDMALDNSCSRLIVPSGGLLLEPSRLYLGRTVEFTETRNFVPMLEGRSSIGRLGLFVHVTAGFGDVGFRGYWTLEIFCVQPVRIYAGVQICQIFYHTIEGTYRSYAGGKYHNNRGIQKSLLYREFSEPPSRPPSGTPATGLSSPSP
ncbi:MAG: dCTP deaminase [Spirochaetaceae bacterium]|nr:MAG: dCTP deaminase [Spirochaetaceae bacterium]